MNSIYALPLRVYLCLGLLALLGLYAGLNLPISLYPNSSKPIIGVDIPYGNYTVQEFKNQHGNNIESRLRGISTDTLDVEKTKVYYSPDGAHFEIEFKWGSSSRGALKETEVTVQSYSSQLPDEVRSRIWVYPQSSNSGFIAVSFFSSHRSLEDLYKILEPVLIPRISKLKDISNPSLWNPEEKEIRIELDLEKMAAFQLMPKDIEKSVRSALAAYNGGFITIGSQQVMVQMPRIFNVIDDLNQSLITSPSKRVIHLSDLAKIDYNTKTTNSSSFSVSGHPGLILNAHPKPGGNVKRMSEDILNIVKSALSSLPRDIQYKVIVDPSEYIRSAVKNVFHEVALGTFLAVAVLFLFIGSFKNTITAAIEIPLSMVLAFIPMKLSGMTINLISLGGLALSAGMNVDASVVVMENIFRHFENRKSRPQSENAIAADKHELSFGEKLEIVTQAVSEVKFPVIASTIASLVVFLPLSFTSNLTYAILGDLAKAVVFSHGFSAFVALLLVPTIRLHLMTNKTEKQSYSFIEEYIKKIENIYVLGLNSFLLNKKLQKMFYLAILSSLIVLCIVVIPRLPKEVIGKPDTEWVTININTQGNTILKQMEEKTADIEAKILKSFSDQIHYTYTEIYQPNQSWLMVRVKDKKKIQSLIRRIESALSNNTQIRFQVNTWNPAELPIPDPPHLRLVVRGGSLLQQARTANELFQLFNENQVFPRLWTEPSVNRSESLALKPYVHLWTNLRNQDSNLEPADLADVVRVLTTGRKIGELMVDNIKRDIIMHYSAVSKFGLEDISALPIGLESKIVPLKALSKVSLEENIPSQYQEDQRSLFILFGKQNEGDPAAGIPEKLEKAKDLVNRWIEKDAKANKTNDKPIIIFDEADREVHEAIQQLLVAIGMSTLLIFFVLIIQFGSLVNALLVMVAIPLGLIGVLISLFVFNSSLSLNSLLGVILLNGIAVGNSIILVAFLKQRVNEGLSPREAALDAAKKRLRPILITSLTSILGMLPVALGLGEGGKVLQPLGIAVSGGLWVSMGLTLFIVPALQVRFLEWKALIKK